MSSDLNKQAVQCFRNITGYMGDRATTKEVREGDPALPLGSRDGFAITSPIIHSLGTLAWLP